MSSTVGFLCQWIWGFCSGWNSDRTLTCVPIRRTGTE